MYIPKNKIITNLYTNGSGEGNPDGSDNDFIRSPFYIKDTNNIYKGYYWKDYKGKYYTGKNPNDKPTQELIFTKPSEVNISTSERFQVTLSNSPSNYPFPGEEETTLWAPTLPSEYDIIRNNNVPSTTSTPPNLNLPNMLFPSPTDENYKLGTFRRYFCVKANEQIFIEINEKTFTLLQTENEEWRWDLYVPFILDWVLTGNENNVRTTNFNSSKIIEVKEKGFQK